jgi:predicted RNA-binding protein with PIN domain
MSQHYVVDGYNLLYALPEMPAGSWEDKRNSLLKSLLDRRPHGANRLTVVFDSREGFGNREMHQTIEVIFTAGETADEWITAFVRKTPQPRSVIVVTDDKGLQRMIRGTGAKSLGAKEFWSRVPTARSQPSPPTEELKDITEELKKKWL